MRIKMLVNVQPDLPFLSKPGTILRAGEEYEATANAHGAISGICSNGAALGVKPGEFIFLEAPAWVLHLWAGVCGRPPFREARYNDLRRVRILRRL